MTQRATPAGRCERAWRAGFLKCDEWSGRKRREGLSHWRRSAPALGLVNDYQAVQRAKSRQYKNGISSNDVNRSRHSGMYRTMIKQGIRGARIHDEGYVSNFGAIASHTCAVGIGSSYALDRFYVKRMSSGIDSKGVTAAATQGQSGIGCTINHIGSHALVRNGQRSSRVATGG